MDKKNSVFISYSHLDKPQARALYERLVASGIHVWIDEIEIFPGDSLLQKIQDGMQQMTFLVVLLSNQSVTSKWVQHELEMAFSLQMEGNFQIIPVKLRPCTLPLFLRGKQFVDLSSREKFEFGFERLFKAIDPNQRTAIAHTSNDWNPEWPTVIGATLVFGKVFPDGRLPVRIANSTAASYRWEIAATSVDAIAGELVAEFSSSTTEPELLISLYNGYRGCPFSRLRVRCLADGITYDTEYKYAPVSLVVQKDRSIEQLTVELLSSEHSLDWYSQQTVYQQHPLQARLTPSYSEHWFYDLVPNQNYLVATTTEDGKQKVFHVTKLSASDNTSISRIVIREENGDIYADV